MKYVLLVFATALSFYTHAADKKIGNLIAIEREVTGVYDSCLTNIKEMETSPGRYSCLVRYLKDPEFSLKRESILRDSDANCDVTGDIMSGSLMLVFKSKNSRELPEAKSCLQESLNKKGPIKVLLYSVE